MRHLVPIAILVLSTLFVYGRILRHEYLEWDDTTHLRDNVHLRPDSLASAAYFWREPYFGLYIPLTYTVFTVEANLAHRAGLMRPDGQPAPVVYHACSLALHVACVLAVYVLLLELVGHRAAACGGALLFALHPLQVESVAWISETKGLLCGLFSMLSLRQYIRFARGGKTLQYALATVALMLALVSKPAAVAVPLMALALDWQILRRPMREIVPALAPWLLLAGIFLVIARTQQTGEMIEQPAPYGSRPFVAADALAFYTAKLFFPLDLTFDYGRTPQRVIADRSVYWTWILPAVACAVIFRRGIRGPGPAAACLFIAGLTPVLGLIPFGYQAISTVADRYVYLAMLGPALGTTSLLAVRPTVPAFGVAATALLGCAGVSFQQASYWRNDETLCRRGIDKNPQSSTAHTNLARYLEAHGDADGAIKHYRAAIDVNPREAIAYNNLGNLFVARGDLAGAISNFDAALHANPGYAAPYYNQGLLAQRRGDPQTAYRLFDAAVQRKPDYLDALLGLALSSRELGRVEESIRCYRRALALKPDWPVAANDLAWILATTREAAWRNGGEAVELAERAAHAIGPDYADVLDTLAAAYAEAGRFDDATVTANKALHLAESQGRAETAQTIRARLQLYQAKRPYRE